MPTIELSIRPRTTMPLEAAAWYLPGADCAQWLEEICSWRVDHSEIRLIVIRGTDVESASGVVAIPCETNFTVSGRCIALGRIGERLYLPANAEVFPSISVGEVDELLAVDEVFIWIPGRGLTVAGPEDLVRVADLIELPAAAGIDWGLAVPGLAFPNRLPAILPDTVPSFDDVIEEGRDDIGERAAKIKDLPKSPNEPMPGIAGAAVRAAMVGAALTILGIAKLVSAIGNLLPVAGQRRASGGQAAGGGGMQRLVKFANDLIQKASNSLEAQRHKEIGRLLHMLDSDPDQGLRHAIPFGGGAHRGLATPGGRLGMRNIDFNLGRLGGGGPADFWDMSPDYQQQLVTKYRELAARETRLGRHRRAAYIYAELLGDFRSAASTLEQGRHYREAAVLYKEKLRDLPAAAACLERGELWNEAIEAYSELSQHEKVGDLLRHIEQHEAADQAYHTAADQLKSKLDLLEAARIYEQKLDTPSLALETLDGGWPDSSQAKRCVEASFALRGRLGWHNEAKQRLAELCPRPDMQAKETDVAEMLVDVSVSYPEASVQKEAGRIARNLAIEKMRSVGDSEARRLVSVLARLDPSDRLLMSDARRYLDSRRSAREVQIPLGHTKKGQLHLIRKTEIGLPGVWRTAVALGEFIVIAGVLEGRVVFARVDDKGSVDKSLTPWSGIPVATDTPLQLFASHSPLRIVAIGESQLPETIVFQGTDPWAGHIRAGTPRGLDIVWGAAAGKMGHLWAISARDDPALICVDTAGAVISTQSLLSSSHEAWSETALPVPIHAAGDLVILGIGDRLIGIKNGQLEHLMRLPSRVIRFAGGGPYAAPILAASMESGVAIIRLGFDGYVREHAPELIEPAVLLNPGGFLVAADVSTVLACELGNQSKNENRKGQWYEMAHDDGIPIAVVPADQSNRFAVVTDKGVVSIYEIGG